MQKVAHNLVALYDASPEHAHFESPIVSMRAQALGKALNSHHIGVIARLASSVAAAIFEAVRDGAAPSIMLSPASTSAEHQGAYRLPFVSHPTIFTGKGALGADMIALASAQAVLIFGSYPGTLENIFESIHETSLPIGILTDEDPTTIHDRVRARRPRMVAQLFVSHDPRVLVGELADELRRRSFNVNIGR